MIFPLTSKIEKVCSNDGSRPVLVNPYLVISETKTGRGRNRKTVRSGTLEATDSYRFLRVPVELADDDVAGVVPIAAVRAARAAKTGEIICHEKEVIAKVVGGTLTLTRPEVAQWVNSEKILPKEAVAYSVGLNARFLEEVARALGTAGGDWNMGVRLDFVADDAGGPNPLRPIQVSALGVDGPTAILMPIRLKTSL